MRRFIIFVFFLLLLKPATVFAAKNPVTWPIQAIDTMKYSRDEARNPAIRSQIPALISQIRGLGATHVAISTPYNEEFSPMLSAWVKEARKQKLSVWFRGNFAQWEGWFDYPPFSNMGEHHPKTDAFIRSHADLFADGDIFTPVPEPENGSFGDPRQSKKKAEEYNQFLIDSYKHCVASFVAINKKVECGFFSMNADIAKEVMTPETVKQTGSVIVIDHYVPDPKQIGEDVRFLHDKLHAAVVFGEFGAPIPDINGKMTEEEQASFVDALLGEMYKERENILGVNYWTSVNGSTAIITRDGALRKAADAIRNYYMPSRLAGRITNTFGEAIDHVTVRDKEGIHMTQSGTRGEYEYVSPSRKTTILFEKEGYTKEARDVEFSQGKEMTQDVKLSPLQPDLLYRIRLAIFNFFQNLLRR